MVEQSRNPQAEAKKAEGNEEFKKGNYAAAVNLYTQAINIQPSEQIYSNRAACLLAMKQFKKAVEDCKAGIRLNGQFQRLYKRLFKAQLALGNIQGAKEAYQIAVQLDSNDQTNKKDLESLQTVEHQQAMIEQFSSEQHTDYERAATFASNILNNCPASVYHACLKCEYLLRSYKLKEASQFSAEMLKIPDMADVPLVQSWRGRIVIYCGNENLGKRMLQDALRVDPDLTEAMKTMKLLKVLAAKKEEASNIFKQNQFEQAITAFDECLKLDPLNLTFNSTICLNKAIAQTKLNKYEQALATLNLCLKMNPDYAKALVKRGEVRQHLEEWDEAVQDFGAAKALDPTGFGVENKLAYAQQQAKKAKKKDYYKILGVTKESTDAEIKKAYRKLALKWHPDKNNDSEEQRARAEKNFKEINEAMAVLSDPDKRKKHDMGFSMEDIDSGMGGMPGGFPGGMQFNMGGGGGPGGAQGMGGIDPNEIFKMFFSQQMGGDDGSFGAFMGQGGGRRGGAGGAQGFPGGFGAFGGMPGFQQQSGSGQRGGAGRGPTFSFM